MIVKLKMLRELAFWKYNEGKDLVSWSIWSTNNRVGGGEIPKMGRTNS